MDDEVAVGHDAERIASDGPDLGHGQFGVVGHTGDELTVQRGTGPALADADDGGVSLAVAQRWKVMHNPAAAFASLEAVLSMVDAAAHGKDKTLSLARQDQSDAVGALHRRECEAELIIAG